MNKLLLLSFILFASQSFARDIEIPYPKSGASLGHGWDSTKARSKGNSCIDFNSENQFPDKSQSINTQVFETYDAYATVRTFAGVESIAGSLSLGDVAISGNAESTFISSLSQTGDIKKFLIRLNVMNSPEVTQGSSSIRLKIKDEYSKLLKQGSKGVSRFYAECGDSFVFQRQGGGFLVGAVVSTSMTWDESNSATLEHGVGINGFKITSKQVSEARLTEINTSSSVQYFLTGGAGSVGATSKEGLEGIANGFPSLVKTDPKIFSIALRGYSEIEGWPKQLSSKNITNKSHDLLAQATRYREILNSISHAISNPALYVSESHNLAWLKLTEDQISTEYKKMLEDYTACLEVSSSCKSLSVSDALKEYSIRVRLPILRGFTKQDKLLLTLETEVSTLRTELNQKWREPHGRPLCNFDPGGYAPDPSGLLGRLGFLCRKVPELDAQINAISTASRRLDVKDAVVNGRIRPMRDSICKESRSDFMCLSQLELDEFLKNY